MKIKRSSSKKQLHKWTKLGVGLAAVTVLGGGTTLAGIDLFHVDTVYAQAQESVTAVLTFYDVSDLSEIADRVYIDVKPGESISYTFPVFDGYTLHEDYDNVLVLDYDDVVRMNGRTYATGFRKVEKPAGDTNSTDTNTVNYTIQLVDQDGQVLQTIQQSGVEGTEVSFDFPVISGYRVGKSEGFDSWTYGKGGTFRLVANKTVKVYYDKAPSIDSLIRPEQRVEYQKVFDTFHTTVLKAFEVYKKELGVDDITYEANDLEKIFADSNLSVLHSELVLEQRLFAKPVGLVLTDQDIINAIGWTPEYWDHQIAYHKEITQKLEKAMANIAAAKATPTDKPAEPPVEQPVDQPVETPADKPAETLVDPSVTKPLETPTETPANSPAETPTNVQPSADQVGQSATEPTVLSNQDSQAGTTSPTGQSAPGKQETKQETKEPTAPASQSKQSTVKPASTSQSQAKSLPATGEVSSVLHLTGLGLLGLAGLVVKRRSGKSS
ncbi:LPXTG cell wall anchor domain-containing protein [Streptococcus suis]|nr:LPXTG cell wall anchor domain-containing protein [Streptococcus suis]NQP51976.1 LPXTG cell wall anchor domain-containing protein [Streptococcus suis]HEM5502833.1 LPXTG cell wall anchor domain-containing protein [Streptococcus suis]